MTIILIIRVLPVLYVTMKNDSKNKILISFKIKTYVSIIEMHIIIEFFVTNLNLLVLSSENNRIIFSIIVIFMLIEKYVLTIIFFS